MNLVKSSAKYTFANNTFVLQERTDPRDRIEVEVGDIKQSTFHPQVKIKRWDNEVNLSVRLIHNKIKSEVNTEKKKINWCGDKVESSFYSIEPCEELPEGGYEFEVTLKEKPSTNKIEFTICSKGLEFYYQSELTQKEIDEGVMRPENVVGSYAVYYKDHPPNYVDGKLYRVGKFCHIFRPRIEDSSGKWAWGILNVDTEKGILSVTIDQKFLDEAVYPVKHAAGATFGYSEIGYYYNQQQGNVIFGCWATGAAGIAQSITGYFSYYEHPWLKYALYTKTGDLTGSLVNGSQTNQWQMLGEWDGWKTLNCTNPPSILAVNYWICWWHSSVCYSYWDQYSTQSAIRNEDYADNWPNPVNFEGTADRIYSIYCTYASITTITPTVLAASISLKAPVVKWSSLLYSTAMSSSLNLKTPIITGTGLIVVLSLDVEAVTQFPTVTGTALVIPVALDVIAELQTSIVIGTALVVLIPLEAETSIWSPTIIGTALIVLLPLETNAELQSSIVTGTALIVALPFDIVGNTRSPDLFFDYLLGVTSLDELVELQSSTVTGTGLVVLSSLDTVINILSPELLFDFLHEVSSLGATLIVVSPTIFFDFLTALGTLESFSALVPSAVVIDFLASPETFGLALVILPDIITKFTYSMSAVGLIADLPKAVTQILEWDILQLDSTIHPEMELISEITRSITVDSPIQPSLELDSKITPVTELDSEIINRVQLDSIVNLER